MGLDSTAQDVQIFLKETEVGTVGVVKLGSSIRSVFLYWMKGTSAGTFYFPWEKNTFFLLTFLHPTNFFGGSTPLFLGV